MSYVLLGKGHVEALRVGFVACLLPGNLLCWQPYLLSCTMWCYCCRWAVTCIWQLQMFSHVNSDIFDVIVLLSPLPSRSAVQMLSFAPMFLIDKHDLHLIKLTICRKLSDHLLGFQVLSCTHCNGCLFRELLQTAYEASSIKSIRFQIITATYIKKHNITFLKVDL